MTCFKGKLLSVRQDATSSSIRRINCRKRESGHLRSIHFCYFDDKPVWYVWIYVLAAGIHTYIYIHTYESLQDELVSFLGKLTCYFWTFIFLYVPLFCLKQEFTEGSRGQGSSPHNTFNEDVFSGIFLHSGISSYHEETQPIRISLIMFQCCGHDYFSRLAVNLSDFDFGAAFLLFVLHTSRIDAEELRVDVNNLASNGTRFEAMQAGNIRGWRRCVCLFVGKVKVSQKDLQKWPDQILAREKMTMEQAKRSGS